MKIKKLDLHKFESENDAVQAVQDVLSKKSADDPETAWEIVCGAGSHTEVTKHGKIAKETGDWKNKQDPLFFQIKKVVESQQGIVNFWIPVEKKASSIYVRARTLGNQSSPSFGDDIGESLDMKEAEERSRLKQHNAKVGDAARKREDELLAEFAALKIKQDSGAAKLSNKEKRNYEKLEKRCAEIEREREEASKNHGDADFSENSDDDDSSEKSDEEVDAFGNTIRK